MQYVSYNKPSYTQMEQTMKLFMILLSIGICALAVVGLAIGFATALMVFMFSVAIKLFPFALGALAIFWLYKSITKK